MKSIKLNKSESDLLCILTDGYAIDCIYKGFFDYESGYSHLYKNSKIDCYSINLISGGTYFFHQEVRSNSYVIIDRFFKSKYRDLVIDNLLK